METRIYTAVFEVGDAVKINYRTYKPSTMLNGRTGKVVKIVFPGDILYEEYGVPNGTGEIKYIVELDESPYKTIKFFFPAEELVKI